MAAWDLGVTHFDTSPYYGFGIAELALRVFAGRTPAPTIATKVGLYPWGGSDLPPGLLLARKLLGKAIPPLSRPQADLGVRRAVASLHGSLRRMRLERVDLLLLHDPDFRLLDTDEWKRGIEPERDRFRAIGVSGEAERVIPFITAGSPICQVVQTRDSASGREADAVRATGRKPDITFGHLASADIAGRAADVLTIALQAQPDSVVLMSTRRIERLSEISKALANVAVKST